MGILDKIADTLVRAPIPVASDSTSRRALSDRERRDRIQRVSVDPDTGEQLLWFDITVSSLGGYSNVPIEWEARDSEHARESFLLWLATEEWLTVDFTRDGQNVELTFRSSWVAGFTIGQGRRRR